MQKQIKLEMKATFNRLQKLQKTLNNQTQIFSATLTESLKELDFSFSQLARLFFAIIIFGQKQQQAKQPHRLETLPNLLAAPAEALLE